MELFFPFFTIICEENLQPSQNERKSKERFQSCKRSLIILQQLMNSQTFLFTDRRRCIGDLEKMIAGERKIEAGGKKEKTRR